MLEDIDMLGVIIQVVIVVKIIAILFVIVILVLDVQFLRFQAIAKNVVIANNLITFIVNINM